MIFSFGSLSSEWFSLHCCFTIVYESFTGFGTLVAHEREMNKVVACFVYDDSFLLATMGTLRDIFLCILIFQFTGQKCFARHWDKHEGYFNLFRWD